MAIALVSKPFDIMNVEEAKREKGCHVHYFLIFESANRAKSVTRILTNLNCNFTILMTGDLYSLLLSKSDNTNRLPKLFASLVALVFGNVWYYYTSLVNYRRITKVSPNVDIVFTDLWRTKVAVLRFLDFKKLIVLDGGFSTTHFGLLPVAGRCASLVVSDYLEKQVTRDYKASTNWLLNQIRFFFRRTLYTGPKNLVSSVLHKISSRDFEIFSQYANNDLHDGIESEHVPVHENTLSWVHNKIQKFPTANEVWIVGHPRLKHLKSQLAKTKTLKGNKTLYFVHPRDGQVLFADPALRRQYDIASQQGKFDLVTDDLTMEWYLLERQILPAKIVTYQSSSIVHLFSVLGLSEKLVYVD